jgi:hypothetical protein
MEKRYIDPALDIGRRWRLLRRADGVTLYENPQAMPRVFVTPRVEVVADADAVLDRLATADLRDVAFVEEPFEAIEAAGDASAGVNGDAPLEASIVEYEANRVQIEASAPRGGLLVLTDQDFPGWRASLDGAPVDIRRADYLFRGVRLPPGRHRVDLLYRPASVAIGLAGTGFAAVLMAALAIGAALAKNEPSSDKGGAKETRA